MDYVKLTCVIFVRRESPRCLSRESSGAPRCPSNDSVYSGRSGAGLPLPAALTAALPAALLPPHSAAVAAYLGAAAAAAQQRLLMSCQDMTDDRGEGVLDFSTKRCESPQVDDDDDIDETIGKNENGPLDLSVGTRKRGSNDSPSPVPSRKSSRPAEFKPSPSPWMTPVAPNLPYFAAAVAAASMSPKGGDWNGKLKHGIPTPSDATKALEKMSELSRLGGEELFRSVQSAALGAGLAPNAAARHSAWQSHWLNKGADQTKDVLKCVWCKKSFNSLADLTVHMKEAKHCGVNVPVPPSSGAPMPSSLHPPSSSPSTPSHNSLSSSGSSKPNQNDLNLLIKENMPIPRKLVRGQDVWLGKGAEQTRQILKCMWCAESFRSLAEMTSHMQRTQHYTNIISQEQIISWKSSDEGKGSSSSSSGPNNAAPPTTGTSSHVSAVLTCKVCDQAFSSLKELSNHMVKNSHYKEHIMRSITESGGRRRQTREKRKKSLPVRKLLEIERATQHEFKNGEGNGVPMGKPIRDFGTGSRITCEKCGDKIETAVFVEHIRQCIGAPMSNSQRNFLKSALLSNNVIPPDMPGHITPTGRDGRKSINEELPSPGSAHHRSPSSVNDSSPSSKDQNASNDKSSSPSVLNAIEQLIEKSFDTRSRHSVPGMPGGASHAPIGSSILKRLGIDESVDYTKPLVDPQTMSMLRSYHHQGYGRRERSGSESSSMSERGGSRVDSLTPDRKLDAFHMTPRTTPDTRGSQTPASEDRPAEVRIKKEIEEDDRENGVDLTSQPVRVKTEVDDEEEHPRPGSSTEEDIKPPVPKRESASPAASPRSPGSDRSGNTPGSERKPASSLGALSSMFDNLAGGSSSGEPSSSRRSGSHPLAALQKLCDKTETNPSRAPAPAQSPAGGGGPPSILTFSWACNDAVVTDSIMKCALCDTPFISKGAYRHHLSKMHFVKDGALPEPVPMKAPPGQPSPSGHKGGSSSAASPQDPRSPSQSFDESPHSKFLKYTELAKQLSSKYV